MTTFRIHALLNSGPELPCGPHFCWYVISTCLLKSLCQGLIFWGSKFWDFWVSYYFPGRQRKTKKHSYFFLGLTPRILICTIGGIFISSDTDSGLPPTLTTALVTTGDLQVEPGRLPPAFYKELVGWLRRCGGPESRRTVCSFLEFVFLYAFVDSGLFPFEEVGGRRVMRQVQDLFVRPTVTTMVDMVRVALTDLCRQLDVDFCSGSLGCFAWSWYPYPYVWYSYRFEPFSSRPWSSAFAEMDIISTH